MFFVHLYKCATRYVSSCACVFLPLPLFAHFILDLFVRILLFKVKVLSK